MYLKYLSYVIRHQTQDLVRLIIQGRKERKPEKGILAQQSQVLIWFEHQFTLFEPAVD